MKHCYQFTRKNGMRCSAIILLVMAAIPVCLAAIFTTDIVDMRKS